MVTAARLQRLRRLLRAWLAPLAGAALFGLVALLLLSNHRSAQTLRENLLRQHAQEDQLHAVALGHFLSSAVEAVTTVAGSNQVAAYFAGRDLGMTMEYGLALSLVPIHEQLQRQAARAPPNEPPPFRRLVLLDEAGRLLADSGSASPGSQPWAGPLDPAGVEGRVLIDPGASQLVVVQAHWWKGRCVGHLVGWLRQDSVAVALTGGEHAALDRVGFQLLDEGGRAYRPERPLGVALGPPAGLEGLPLDGRPVEVAGGALLAVRVAVPGHPLSVVLVRRASDLLGGLSSGASALGLSLAAGAILLVVGLALYLNTASLVLRARLEESLRRGQEVADKHAALEREVAERRRLEAAHARLAMAAEQADEAMAVTDVHGVFEYVNPAFIRAAGCTAGAVLGRPASELLGEPGRPALAEITRAMRAGQAWKGEVSWAPGGGEPREVEMVVSPVRDAAGALVSYVVVARDVTEQRQLLDRLRHAQRLEAVGTLAGGVAHDFNNLLTAIKGYAGAALDLVAERDPVREDLQEIQRAASRGAELVRQLLAFGRKQVLRPQRLDLDQAVAGVDKLLRRLAGERAELVVVPGAAPWLVEVDPGQLEQVLVNLVVNARDAMPAGGTITISTAAVALGEAEARRFVEGAPGEFVRLSVADTGEGMDEPTRARVFEPFFTTKERGRGTGLGLSTVFGIVRQSRGFLGVSSAPGAGTRFDVFLPRDTAAAAAAPAGHDPEAPPARTRSGRSEEVLLVAEDEPQVRALLQRQLAAEGYTVLVAADGREAVALLERHAGRVDLLLTDMVMPNLGGPELARHFRERHPASPVIFMSGYAEPAADGVGPRGADGVFVQKPFAVAELAATVRRLLDAGRGA
ncbi:MAG: response regulator [Anaeromyxobacter sp.]|nr:response regulator [Anaeromyxobacter sp.]MBL0278050.1 response regulator [Anaeromyxobacter sp.]